MYTMEAPIAESPEKLTYLGYKAILRPPRYTHDSDCCIYLGRFRKHDLYYCSLAHGIPFVLARDGTVLARFGDEDWQCFSGMASSRWLLVDGAAQDPFIASLKVALSRAIQAGLYKGSDSDV